MNQPHDTIIYYRQRAQQMRDRAAALTGIQANLYDEASELFERLADSLLADRQLALN